MFLPDQEFLQRAYGLHCLRVEPTQGGLSALAYLVKSGEGTFFLKVYPGERAGGVPDTAYMAARLAALADMEKSSPLQGHLCPAVATTEGELLARQNGDVYLLFPALVGETPGFGARLEKETARELGRLCRVLHELDPALFGKGLPQEDFSLPFLPGLRRAIKGEGLSPSAARSVRPYRMQLDALCTKTQAAARYFAAAEPVCCLCHTDLHGGNLMLRREGVTLLDWEGLCLAPREADLFLLWEGENGPVAREGYGPIQADPVLLEFYRDRRRLEDIAEFLQALGKEVCPQEEEQLLFYLTKELKALPEGEAAPLLSSVRNIRDLGGRRTHDGEHTRYGHIFRSDLPIAVTDKEKALLRRRGVTCILDLRTKKEAERFPCSLAGEEGFCYQRFPLPGGDALPASPSQIAVSYLGMTTGTALPRALRTLARAEGGALFFCSAGKDRTGVMSAVLLMLCGVLDEEIEADHLLSKENLMPELQRFARQTPGVDLRVILPCSDYIRGFLDLFRVCYGSAKGYLQKNGFSEEEIALLQKKLRG